MSSRSLHIALFLFLLTGYLWIALVEFSVHPSGDEIIYLTVGKGILNGLHPWRDLFETKPPMIFWISAVSLLFKGDVLYRSLLLLGFAGMMWLLYQSTKRSIALLFSFVIGTYVILLGSGYQTEVFALFPVTLALVTCRRQKIIPALCLCFLALLKEPFVIGTALAIFLLTKDVQKCLRIGFMAALLMLGVLLVSGTMGDYFSIYLPEMFGDRIQSRLQFYDFSNSQAYYFKPNLFIKGLHVRELLTDPFYIGLGLTAIFLIAHLLRMSSVAIAIVLLSIFAMDQMYAIHKVISFLHRIPWESRFFLWKVGEFLATIIGVILLCLTLSRSLKLRVSIVLLLVYAMTFMSGIGNFLPQHLIFSLPIWIMLFLLYLDDKKRESIVLWSILVVSFFSFLSLEKIVSGDAHPEAAVIDRLMDACGIDRYMANDIGITAFTNHSPYQTEYGIYRATSNGEGEIRTEPNKFLKNKLEKDWNEARLVISKKEKEPFFPPNFDQVFTQNVPDCAQNIQLNTELHFFFRK